MGYPGSRALRRWPQPVYRALAVLGEERMMAMPRTNPAEQMGISMTNDLNAMAASAENDSHDDQETAFENFESLASKLLKVPKEEVDEKRAEWEETRKRNQS